MALASLDDVRHETRLLVRVQGRDLAKRLAALALILAIVAAAGEPRWAALIALATLPFEASMALLMRRMPPPDREVGLGLVIWAWLTNVPSTLAYCLPALPLAAHGHDAFVVMGWLWFFGLCVHMSNGFIAMPFYNWSQMVPCCGFGLLLLAVTAEGHAGSLGDPTWLLACALFGVYALNTVETMTTQKEFHAEMVAARQEARARLDALEHLARHDPLTGLLNRQAFDEDLARLLAMRRMGRVTAVLLFDLDGFKPVNDTYGHAAGDALLVAIARRLAAFAGPGGLPARLGGDEFALAVPGLASAEEALLIGRKLQAEVGRPVEHDGKTLGVSASLGLAVSAVRPPPGAEEAAVAQLCGEADQAMFRAKAAARAGLGADRGPVAFDAGAFPPRASLEDRRLIAEALAERAIRPEYQPVVDLETGRVAGFEALARWHRPDGRLLSPAEFLPLVAELGLGGDFLAAIARQVLEDVAALVAEGLDPGRVSLNVPEVALATLTGRAEIDRLLAAHPAARPHLVFEITEDVFIARAADMIQGSIAHFRAQGVGISLDDFGTGFASFRHLREIEFDELKLDGSFVADLGRDGAAEILVGGFVTMGEGLGARIVAEGVETEAQRRHVLRLGCRLGQGFLFGRALPFAEARARLRAEQGEGKVARLTPRPVRRAGA